jgi:hypothetical protein
MKIMYKRLPNFDPKMLSQHLTDINELDHSLNQRLLVEWIVVLILLMLALPLVYGILKHFQDILLRVYTIFLILKEEDIRGSY